MFAGFSSFDLQKVFAHMPTAKAIQLANVLKENMYAFGICNEVVLAHFLSQAGHESGGFRTVEENLNYSAESLVKTWSKRFSLNRQKGKLLAKDFARNPKLIANAVYARKSLGNSLKAGSNDGWNFRGRGFIQLTGKSNYKEFETFYNKAYNASIDLMENPDLIAKDLNLAMISSLWFFREKIMNKINVEYSSVEQITRLVNGGTKGLDERKHYFQKAMEGWQFFVVPDNLPDLSSQV